VEALTWERGMAMHNVERVRGESGSDVVTI
jgi:hypothetical protein